MILALSASIELVAPNSPVQQDGSVGINLFQSRFSALVLSATAAGDGDGSLPEKENIGPNQRSWPERAARMGVKHGNKRREKGKVDSALTAQHIGEPNRKRAADNDPYGAGEQSGKHAKPDARSAAANARARAAQEQAAIKAEPPRTQPPPPPPTHPPPPPPPQPLPLPASLPFPVSLPASASFSPYTYNHYHFHSPPLSQPRLMYSHSQGAPSAPPYYPAFSTYSYSHYM
ncbi:hypothetical protein F5888DRAFT_1889320 [Russula emetica]|nr:hypothetical protein F5888DRAFT_1889320 [Russula emetica]